MLFNTNCAAFICLLVMMFGKMEATELKQMVVEEESPVGTVVKTSAAIVNGLKLLYNDFAVKCNINKCELVTKKVFDVDTMSQPFIRLHYQYPNDIPRTTIVNIKNINDNEPQFVNQPYKTSIPEDFPVNTTLPNLKIEAVDKDFNANKPELSLSPVGQNSVGIEDFMKLNMDGTIELLKPLDYETRNFFEFIAYANDSKYVTNASVWIQVTDVQDMPPTFISSSFVVNIPENSKKDAVVTTVKAIDQDRGVPHVINYEITSDACNHTFRVNNTSGEIRVAKTPFDRESTDIEAKNGVCTLDIMAYEVGNKQNGNATKRITIFVEDVNDNVPSFNKMSFNATVSESASKGNPIMLSDTITITDKDTVKYNKFRLSLTTLDDKPFDILKIYPEEALGETSVVLSVNKPDELDYEKRENISFKVVAVDVNNSSYSNAVTVDLKINPMNEFAPSFKQQIYYVNISENMKSDNLTTITADDEDKGKDGHLEYSLSGDTKFTINNETGQISVSALDYEAGGEYKLTIKATDGGNRNSETTLMVSVIDVNDNSPIFDQKLYSVRLDENKDSFERELIVKAKDADEPNSNNSKLNYSIEKASQNLKNNFTIDASGEIIPSKIDFDILTDNIIQLTILAVDSGVPTRNSTTIVNITVLDENDNAPVFNQRVYNADVTEDTKIDTSILSVGAKDNDITFNQLTYRLNPFSSIFRINSKDGKIYLASPLDREKISAYNLTVEAMDNGTPSKSGSAEINIQIKDINDEKPELIIKNNDIKIKENITIGSIIATLNATDEDLDAKLVFRIVQQKNELDGKGREVNEISKSDNFEINSTTGDITVKKELNREEFERISLELRVTDNNTVIGDNYDTKFLKITILDVNDCAPVFRKQSHSLNVIENYPLHDNFATFQATDEDVNDNVTYTIIDQSNKFNITPSTGSIFLVDRLDREEEANLTFTIVASDSGSPPLSSSINISVTVKDFNDNAPEFQNVLKSIAVPEDTAINSTIARIHARDNDTGIHASITYQLDQIVPRAVNSPFTIDMLSGNISLKENIDRETVEVYTVRIFAQDNYNRATKFQEPGWKRSSAILIINITDINDHSPQFNSIACQNVQEDMIGSIMTITATDKDIGRNNKVEYSIFGNESALFKIDPQSGKLSVNSSLTNKVGLKYFTVEATDKGTPALNSSTSVCINVTDINNNPPTFSMTHDNVTVSESVCVGSEIYTLHAIDADYGINKKISYKLENFEDDSFFKIDDSKLILNKKLDYESKPKYQVKIKATDSGKPKLTSSDFFLTVFVENINDEPPEFSETFKNVTLEEGPAQRKFGPFEATHSGFKLCYNLSNTSDSQYFTVNQSTAFIETNQEIDYESKKSFEIELVVKTCSELQFNSSCSDSSKNNKNNKLTINVTVTDIDDNPPKFTQKSYSQAIVFDISKEERIFDLTPHVRDRDTLPENKKHKFSINSTTNFGNEALQQIKVPFRIRDNSVHSNVDFDSNVGGRVQLKIMVEDGNNMNDTAMLNIHILSEKDKVTIQFKLNADSVRKSKEDFVKFIQGLLGDKFVVIPGKIDVLNKGNGEVDSSRSTMGLYAIKNNTNEVLPPEKLLSFLDSRRLINEAQFGKFAVENVKENAPVVSEDPEEKTLMILIPIIVLLALIVIVLIMVFHASVVRYNRKLRAAETNSRPLEKPEEVRYPGTNVFSEGQINPLYNNMEDADTAAPLPDKLSLSSQILDVNQITTNMDDLNDINNTYEMPMDNSRVDLINVLSEREAALNVQNIQYDNNDEDYYDDIEVTDV